ncbi:MAG TPA: aldolase/citrate lyase family protein, partial [Allocoleopsis sp.]
MPNRQLKQKLQRGEIVFGPFMNSSYPAFIEICGYAGFDFAIIDLEHGALNTLVAEDLCRAADCVNIAPIIRVSKNDPSQIQRALDIGSAGVQVPQIESKLDGENVVKAAKYYPLGNRGLSFATRAGNYTSSGTDITTKLNQDSLVIIHVEGQKG